MLGLNTITCGIYCRTARADYNGMAEGLGITSQRTMLEHYVKERGFTLAGCYADEGCAGTTPPCDRKGFNRLMSDYRAGKINCVIVRSIDRIGRGYKSESHITELFIEQGLRLISVGEGLDSSVDSMMDILFTVNGSDSVLVKRASKRTTPLSVGGTV